MIRSLYAAVSGLKNHQNRMDVIGNNISNVNTTAFKTSRVNFEDMLSQTIRGASDEQVQSLGVNAAQIGIGSMISTIDMIFNQGTIQYTGRPLDVAISGEGFFVVENDEDKQFITRDGSFSIDKGGNLVNNLGYKVLDSSGDPISFGEEGVESLTIDRLGLITGTTLDGTPIEDIQIGLCFVQNPESLMKEGNNLYSGTVNTKLGGEDSLVDYAGDGDYSEGMSSAGSYGRGILEAMSLESSNVDLSQEFSNMIITQRGYQANSRIISIADQMLEELINLKR